MKSILHKLFRSSEPQSPVFDQEHALQVATATLLVEVCRADFVEQQSELDRMRQLLRSSFR